MGCRCKKARFGKVGALGFFFLRGEQARCFFDALLQNFLTMLEFGGHVRNPRLEHRQLAAGTGWQWDIEIAFANTFDGACQASHRTRYLSADLARCQRTEQQAQDTQADRPHPARKVPGTFGERRMGVLPANGGEPAAQHDRHDECRK